MLLAIVALALTISLIASRISLRFPQRAFVSFQLSLCTIVLVGLAAIMWRRVAWTPLSIDFAWFVVAMSAMGTTTSILGILAWKRICGQRDEDSDLGASRRT